jgi:ADP-ribose pyrophosphatase YjhB (NUDIX family)
MAITSFTIRVYGLLIRNGRILLVHEKIGNFAFTKFPGGGMQFGEGTIDCLKREFIEETGLNVKSAKHFYTTDFFQQSAFNKEQQIISVYYTVEVDGDIKLPSHEHIITTGDQQETLRFEWVELNKLSEALLTFPIDKLVCRLLLAQ